MHACMHACSRSWSTAVQWLDGLWLQPIHFFLLFTSVRLSRYIRVESTCAFAYHASQRRSNLQHGSSSPCSRRTKPLVQSFSTPINPRVYLEGRGNKQYHSRSSEASLALFNHPEPNQPNYSSAMQRSTTNHSSTNSSLFFVYTPPQPTSKA
ncbi:hypothetical protein BS50DRAFT_167643 [Corynespora cassiicola Philippines]|uniref:Uncharacterized protein n=1 Tax=Corynespora cassiicola Philippines TaxID=1448308 RepID=A0A2T2P601_CORCC|nr:hypothetical protein BS50DRAFT_167643 [Corynespora cassiicola Philippines]